MGRDCRVEACPDDGTQVPVGADTIGDDIAHDDSTSRWSALGIIVPRMRYYHVKNCSYVTTGEEMTATDECDRAGLSGNVTAGVAGLSASSLGLTDLGSHVADLLPSSGLFEGGVAASLLNPTARIADMFDAGVAGLSASSLGLTDLGSHVADLLPSSGLFEGGVAASLLNPTARIADMFDAGVAGLSASSLGLTDLGSHVADLLPSSGLFEGGVAASLLNPTARIADMFDAGVAGLSASSLGLTDLGSHVADLLPSSGLFEGGVAASLLNPTARIADMFDAGVAGLSASSLGLTDLGSHVADLLPSSGLFEGGVAASLLNPTARSTHLTDRRGSYGVNDPVTPNGFDMYGVKPLAGVADPGSTYVIDLSGNQKLTADGDSCHREGIPVPLVIKVTCGSQSRPTWAILLYWGIGLVASFVVTHYLAHHLTPLLPPLRVP